MGDALDSRAFRDALGRFATGVCVITTATDDGQLVGITANSFASVSLDPALVLWSPAKTSRRHDVFVEAPAFTIHVLSEDQQHIANGFVKEAHAFAGFDWSQNPDGVPEITGCAARFTCRKWAAHDAGDHTVVLGQVTAIENNPGSALVFAEGKYTGLR